MKTAVFFYQVVYEGLSLHIVVIPPLTSCNGLCI